MNYDFDVAVIGAGTAGLVSAVVADSLGAKVTLIERERVGGECLWTGCVPSKALIKSARVWDTVQRSEEFGVHVESRKLVWNAVKLRLQDVRDEIKKLEREELAKSGVQVLSGAARFEDAHTLRLEGRDARVLRARKFILACGSRVRVPDLDGLEDAGFITHQNVYDLPSLPRSMVILGGGPIGCEFAQAFARFGTRVTLLQHGARLLPREDEEISTFALKILRDQGVEVLLGAEAVRAGQDDRGRFVEWRGGDGQIGTARGSQLLVATGKTHDFADLNLEAVGVEWSRDGIETNAHLRTSARHIWACGDATGRFHFTHYAEHEAKVAAQNAVLPVKASIDLRAVPWTTFLDPEIARVGQTEAEARANGEAPQVFRAGFKTLDRAIIEGEASGLCKIVTSRSGRVLGAHLAGPSAGELIHPFVLAVRDGMLLSEFADMIHVYPTLSEIAHRAGNEVYKQQLQSPLVKRALCWLRR